MAHGAQAEQLTQRLLSTSQHFLDAEPGNPAAVYYNVGAQFAELRPEILNTRNPQKLCQDLKELLGALDAALPRASGTDYKTSVTRLQADITGVKRTVAGCN
jgi:hypothetical protein